MPGGLRTARHCVFTGGVVTASGFALSGGAYFVLTGRWQKAPPSGELARERLRGFALPLRGSRLRGFPLDISPFLHYNASKMNHSKMKG